MCEKEGGEGAQAGGRSRVDGWVWRGWLKREGGGKGARAGGRSRVDKKYKKREGLGLHLCIGLLLQM